MELQTQITISQADNQIDYNSQLLLLGSCFVENMGKKFDDFKFRLLQNPFGILFHPLAIENLISRSVGQKDYSEDDIFFSNERWHCFEAHSDLSDTSVENLLKKLNHGLGATLKQLEGSSHIVITLGTAWIYRHLATEAVVANCHKVAQKEFSKELLSIETVSTSLAKTIALVRSVNKDAQFIFTVSPVRHLKDGFVENQRSKAHLIAALHHILNTFDFVSCTSYFPSYELQMDELRDYRFYEADMIHPNQVAINYIWERFKKTWISKAIYPTMDEVETIQKGINHRPFNRDSEQHKKFLASLNTKIESLQSRYPFMKFDKAR